MSAPVDVKAVLEQTSAGLWSVANNCSRSDLSTTMRSRAEEFDRAKAAVDELIAAADDYANRGGMYHSLKRLRNALACARGGAA